MTSTATEQTVLVLRLAGPMQSWGDRSAFNRRETQPEPTKSGVIGLLAAAQGRPREQSPQDLAGLHLGVRVDQPGSLLRDYHTASDYRGRALPQAGIASTGAQKLTSPAKHTHVTQRFYLQDAVFLAAVSGPSALVHTLAEAVRRPVFPLALGRRSCSPTQPIVLGLRTGGLEGVLRAEPWQATEPVCRAFDPHNEHPPRVDLPATLDDEQGADMINDVPLSFAPGQRHFTTRRIRHTWMSVPTGFPHSDKLEPDTAGTDSHDPFALLGW